MSNTIVQEYLQRIYGITANAGAILITGQGNPDGDSLGAELVLREMIMQQRQRITPAALPDIVICNDEPTPRSYEFFPGIHRIVPIQAIAGRRFDAGFVVDAGTDRVGKVFPLLQTCRDVINIDHHRTRAAGIETLAWIEPNICSVCEMLFAFFESSQWALELTPDIAACLYAGIIYDTGVFRYPNTTSRTLEIAAKLLATGIDFAMIVEKLFLEKSLAGLRLQANVLNSLKTDSKGEILWGKITQRILQESGATFEDEEGMISTFTFARGTKAAVLFKEFGEREIKISFRAWGAVDVGQVAKRLSSQGGGHARAAGVTLLMPIEDAERLVIAALAQALESSASQKGN